MQQLGHFSVVDHRDAYLEGQDGAKAPVASGVDGRAVPRSSRWGPTRTKVLGGSSLLTLASV